MTNPPKPIAEFFRLKNAEDEDALPLLFSEDAIAIAAGSAKRGAAARRLWGGLRNRSPACAYHKDIRSLWTKFVQNSAERK